MYKVKYLECSCYSAEHTLRFSYDDNDTNELYIEICLYNYNSIFWRALAAIKYVFGYKSRYGHFDCMILERDKVKKLKDELDLFLGLNKTQ